MLEIRKKYSEGASKETLEKEYNRCPASIKNIIAGRVYKNLTKGLKVKRILPTEYTPVPGYEMYGASKDGSIFSLWNYKVMSPHINKYGYLQTIFHNQNQRKTVLIHRMILLTFVGESHLPVNHIDGNKLNNDISNLEYCTNQENIDHAIRTGLMDQKGENHHNSKLTEFDIIKIRRLYIQGTSQKELAEKFNIGQPHISSILLRKTWKHVP